MSELPEAWVSCSLEELLTSLESGSRPRGGVRGIREGVPSVGGEHLTYGGGFDFTSIKYVPADFAANMAQGHIQTNDILIVKDGATTGKTAFVSESFPYPDAVVNEHVFACRPTKQIEPRFLFRYLTSKEGQERILENFQGSAQGGINRSFAPNTEVPLAPLDEQRRIVAKLEKLLGRVDAAQARFATIPRILKRFRQSVLSAACSGRLTADWRLSVGAVEHASELIKQITKDSSSKPFESDSKKHSRQPTKHVAEPGADSNHNFEIPESWTWASLDTIRQEARPIIYGIIKPGPHIPDGVPYVRVTEMKEGFVDIPNLKRTSHVRAAKFARATLKAGDILISKDGTIGRVAVVPPELEGGNITQHVIRLPVHDLMNRDYVALAIKAPEAQKWMTGETRGVALQGVNVEDFRRLPIPIPPLTEQQEIVRRVEALFKTADALEERYRKAKAHVDKLAQSILARAFRGELVPTEAELARQEGRDYEPAAALLERIRQERARAADSPKPKTRRAAKGKKDTATKKMFA